MGNQTDLNDGQCLQCRRGFYLNGGKCAQCSDSNCDVCSHTNGSCQFCKEGFELSAEASENAQGQKCIPCGKDEFWSKMNGRCTPTELNQYVIFGEGQGVISDKSYNVLTSN